MNRSSRTVLEKTERAQVQFDLFDVGRPEECSNGRDHRGRLGKSGEYFVAFEFTVRGFDVTIAAEGLPYDLLVDIENRIVRVQVRTTGRARDGRYMFSLLRCSHKGEGKSRHHTPDGIDLFAFVAADIRKVVFATAAEVLREGDSTLHLPASTFLTDVTALTFDQCLRTLRTNSAA